jgi:hypothetical protein
MKFLSSALSVLSLLALLCGTGFGQTIYVNPIIVNNETTNKAPDLVAFNGRLYLAWTGTDPQRKVNIISSSNGTTWDPADKVILTATAAGGLGLGVIDDGEVRRIYVSYHLGWAIATRVSTDGTAWSAENIVEPWGNHDNNQPPTIDYPHSSIGLLGWRGTDSRLSLHSLYPSGDQQSSNPAPFTGNSNDRSPYNPEFKAASGAWLKAWTGDDPTQVINTILNHPARGYYGNIVYQITGAYSNDGPTVAFNPPYWSSPNRIVVGFLGRDPGKTLNLYLNNYSTASIRQLNQWSNNAPAVECFNGKIWVAWRGGDNKLNIASVDFWH